MLRILFTMLATLLAASANADGFRVIPERPVTGLPATIVVITTSGCAVADHGEISRFGTLVTIDLAQMSPCFSPPTTVSSSNVFVPSSTGTHIVAISRDGATTREVLGTFEVLEPTSASPPTVTTVPETPIVGQDFFVVDPGTVGLSCGPTKPATASVEAGEMVWIRFDRAATCDVFGGLSRTNPFTPVGVAARASVAGVHRLREIITNPDGSVIDNITATTFSVAAASPPVVRTAPSIAGLWYVPSEPGWGVTIAEGESGNLFVVWYGYPNAMALDRVGTWSFASGGQWIAPNVFSAPLFLSYSPPVDGAFTSASAKPRAVGMLTLTVSSSEAITFTVRGHDGAPIDVTRTLGRFRF